MEEYKKAVQSRLTVSYASNSPADEPSSPRKLAWSAKGKHFATQEYYSPHEQLGPSIPPHDSDRFLVVIAQAPQPWVLIRVSTLDRRLGFKELNILVRLWERSDECRS